MRVFAIKMSGGDLEFRPLRTGADEREVDFTAAVMCDKVQTAVLKN